MPLTFLDFGTLQWGAGEHGDGLAFAENVVPAYGLKRPLQEWRNSGLSGNTVADATLNSIYCHIYPVNSSAASYVGDAITEFHGSKTNIYTFDPATATWTSLRSGLAAAGEPPAGRFASWGNDVWYCNRIDNLQVRANNTGNFVNGTGASVFKPIPRFICVVKSYMMAFDLNNGAGYYSDSYAWSVPGNPAVWDAAASGGGGTGRITSRPGQIMGAIGGEFARVFKRNSIHVLQYTGDVLNPWREDIISDTVGTPWPSSIVQGDQGNVYFIGQDYYFYRQNGVSPPERISPYEVTSFISDAAFSPGSIHQDIPSTMTQEDLWVQGCYNSRTGVCFWVYRDATDPVGLMRKSRGVFYSTITGEFTTWDGDSPSSSGGIPVRTLGSLPGQVVDEIELPESLEGVIATNVDDTSSARMTFAASGVFRARLITRKQALSLSQQESPITVPVRINRILPVISTRYENGYDDYDTYNEIPSQLEIRVTVSNDPNFKVVTSGATQVNPRHETATAAANADPDDDWFPFVESQGTWQIFELRLPTTATLTLRSMPGLWIDWSLS